jgi:hypothetical protein
MLPELMAELQAAQNINTLARKNKSLLARVNMNADLPEETKIAALETNQRIGEAGKSHLPAE